MTKKILLFFITLVSCFSYAQENYTLSGIVSEESSGETLIGVNVIFPDQQRGTVTNGYGFYSITLKV